MKRFKKGFTLIELLAVILILGVIALIAIPTINNIITEAKLGSNNVTAKNIVDTVEKKCELAKISGKSMTGIYSISEIKSDVKGKVDATGYYTIDDDCNVSLAIVYDDFKNYCYGKAEDGEVLYYETDDNMTCLPVETEPTPASCFTYTEENNEITITGYTCGGTITKLSTDAIDNIKIDSYTLGTNMDVIIPNYIDGKPVTKIGFASFLAGNLETQEIDPNKKSIIHSLVVPSNIREIEQYAFAVNKISKLVLTEGITNIDAFAFANGDIKSLLIPNTVTTLGEATFVNNKITGNLVISSTITTIGPWAFGGNDITSIDLNTNVGIGRGAFYSWYDINTNSYSNTNLRKIINRTGSALDWSYLISSWDAGYAPGIYESGDYLIDIPNFGSYTINITTE